MIATLKSVIRQAVGMLIKVMAGILIGSVLLSCALIVLFRFVPVPLTSVMVERELTAETPYARQYRWVPLSKMSDALKVAVIAAEDQRFPDHHGFDVGQIDSAWQRWWRGHALRGASTISQQTAKNLLLWTRSDWVRKVLEVPFTLLIETLWSKSRILEVYLNIVEWDRGVFGAEAAARHYFKTSASNLSIGQSVRLAAVLPAPLVWNPTAPNAHVMQRMIWIERQMRQLGGRAYLNRLSE